MKHLNSFFILAFLTVSLLTTKAQTSEVIDPDNYSFANPYVIPSLPNGNVMNIIIKTGKPIHSIIDLADNNSLRIFTPDGRSLLNVSEIEINFPGTWTLTYRQNGAERATGIQVNYQADIYDRTIGSATYVKRPDFIWVNAAESAVVSAGPWIGQRGIYGWNDGTTWTGWGGADSLYTCLKGNYIVWTVDGSGSGVNTGHSQDTISILEKPTFNTTTKTLNFPTTTTGVTYKLLKAGAIVGTDTTWTETQNFIGDGNTKEITLTEGKYKLTTTRGIHTAVYPYGYFEVSVTTALDKTKQQNINYRLVDNNLQFDNEVNLKFYSLQGQLLQQGNGSSFKLVRQAGIFTATDKNGNTLTIKVLQK